MRSILQFSHYATAPFSFAFVLFVFLTLDTFRLFLLAFHKLSSVVGSLSRYYLFSEFQMSSSLTIVRFHRIHTDMLIKFNHVSYTKPKSNANLRIVSFPEMACSFFDPFSSGWTPLFSFFYISGCTIRFNGILIAPLQPHIHFLCGFYQNTLSLSSGSLLIVSIISSCCAIFLSTFVRIYC